jgi:hypothetical protein
MEAKLRAFTDSEGERNSDRLLHLGDVLAFFVARPAVTGRCVCGGG